MVSPQEVAERVHEAVESCRWARERIVLMTGGSAGERSDILTYLEEHDGFSHLSIGIELSARLLDVPVRRRGIRARTYFRELVDEAEEQSAAGVVALDHIEMLFTPNLALDVFGLLRGEAVNRTLVVSWCGRIDNGRAVYAKPSHPEYCSKPVSEHAVVRVEDVGA